MHPTPISCVFAIAIITNSIAPTRALVLISSFDGKIMSPERVGGRDYSNSNKEAVFVMPIAGPPGPQGQVKDKAFNFIESNKVEFKIHVRIKFPRLIDFPRESIIIGIIR